MDDPYRAPDPSWSSDTQASDDASFPGYNSGATPNYPPVEPDPSTFPSPPAYMPSQMPQQQWQSGPIGGPAPSGPLAAATAAGTAGLLPNGSAAAAATIPAMAIQAAGRPRAIWPLAVTTAMAERADGWFSAIDPTATGTTRLLLPAIWPLATTARLLSAICATTTGATRLLPASCGGAAANR